MNEDVRERLLRRRRVLAGDIRGLENDACGREARPGGDTGNPAGEATDNAERDVSLGRMESQNREIHEIDEALERVEDGTFGRCEDCERPLPPERLDAIPYARRCAACQGTHEREGDGA